DLFPIEIKSSSNLAIKDLQSSGSSGIAIDIHPSINTNRGSTSTLSYVQINIPSALIPRISSVTNTVTNEGNQQSITPIDFNTTNSSSTYNTINIRLPSGIHNSQLSINGISKANNTGTTNNLYNTYLHTVSIVKYASDTSTRIP